MRIPSPLIRLTHCLVNFAAPLMFATVIVSCATVETKKEVTELYFPAPPDPPRFVFERSVIGSADLLEGDESASMRRLLTGQGVSSMGFSKPFDVTACKGTMYVSDTVRRSVLAFNAVHNDF